MPSEVIGVAGTFVLSLIVAYGFLRLRCRGIGPPFGPRARYWALFIVVGTAVTSSAVGLLLVVAGKHVPAYVAIIVPSGLWLSKLPPQRDRDMLPRNLVGPADAAVQPPLRPDGRRHAGLVRHQAGGGVAQSAVDIGRGAVLLAIRPTNLR